MDHGGCYQQEKQYWRTRETVLEGLVRLLATGTTLLVVPQRLLTNRSNRAGGARKDVNNRSSSAGTTREVVYNMKSVLEGQGRLVTDGGTVLDKPETLTT